jgi:hypothetical protein
MKLIKNTESIQSKNIREYLRPKSINSIDAGSKPYEDGGIRYI